MGKRRILTISIVMYQNYGDTLNALASIEKYTNANITKRIYLIDNSCYDKDCKERKEFETSVAQYEDVVYVDAGGNLGFGKGHNLVLKELDSEYHAIVNPDIILESDAFEAIVKFMEDDTIGMCVPRITDADGVLQPVYRRDLTVVDMFIRMFMPGHFQKRQAYHSLQDMDFEKAFHLPVGQGSFLVIRTDLFKELNGFDDRYFMYMEDVDLCKQVNRISKFMYCPDATVIHRWERGSHKNGKLFFVHLQSMIKYFRKWGIKWV